MTAPAPSPGPGTKPSTDPGSAPAHVTLVNLDDCTPQPWRNGGGLTQELLAWPHADDWQLRVSVARIERDGPFSAFAGMRRHFAVLHGAGVVLDLPEGACTLTPAAEPIAFDGEAAPMCRLLAGPTQDLNLMSRRGAGRAHLRRARPGETICGRTRWRGVFTAGGTRLQIDAQALALPAGALAWSAAAAASQWQLQDGGPAWFLTLED